MSFFEKKKLKNFPCQRFDKASVFFLKKKPGAKAGYVPLTTTLLPLPLGNHLQPPRRQFIRDVARSEDVPVTTKCSFVGMCTSQWDIYFTFYLSFRPKRHGHIHADKI